MLKFQFPFSVVNLNKDSSILLDACFLLALQDEKHNLNEKCIEISNLLIDKKCKLYVSNVVLAEVLNKIIQRLFISDIGYRFTTDILNSQENINKIITYFYPNEQKVILTATEEKFNKYKFMNHFDYIIKETEDIELLRVYFQEAIFLLEDLEQNLKLNCLPINANMVLTAKQFYKNFMMGINDAQHLSVALVHRLDYILTLDGDFEKIPVDKVKILKVEKSEIIESTGTED